MQALFQHICAQLSLGDMIAAPVSLSGGYTHRMFSLSTTQGKYAVKLLNPEIMARPDALANYARAEAHEAAFEAAGLPILPAKVIGGRKMQCVDGQYLYVFDFYPGRMLQDSEITPAHCAAMGEVLARIHSLESASPQTNRPEGAVSPGPTEEAEDIDWPLLVAALLRDPEARWHGSCMHRALPMLVRVTRAMVNATARLPRREALCHNDMDAKNILWHGSDYRIIDLECIGFANPEQELLDLAVSWAGCDLNEAKFRAFIESYRAAGGRIRSDPADLFDSRRNHLDWLAYNARRALHSDMEERRTGREQIEETLEKLAWDQRNRSRILVWLSEY